MSYPKRTPRVKIDEVDLIHFPGPLTPDPYWREVYEGTMDKA